MKQLNQTTCRYPLMGLMAISLTFVAGKSIASDLQVDDQIEVQIQNPPIDDRDIQRDGSQTPGDFSDLVIKDCPLLQVVISCPKCVNNFRNPRGRQPEHQKFLLSGSIGVGVCQYATSVTFSPIDRGSDPEGECANINLSESGPKEIFARVESPKNAKVERLGRFESRSRVFVPDKCHYDYQFRLTP